MSTTVLGVDAGNTKTVALVASEDGEVLGWGRGGAGDIYGSEIRAVQEVRRAVDAALARAEVGVRDVSASCFSLVGADWPEDFAFWRRELGTWSFGHSPVIVNDALGALRSGSPHFGVAVACGTGAAVGARGMRGAWHSSFWQLTGGGFELGERALRAVYLSHLGLAPPTRLTERVLSHFGLENTEALLHVFTTRNQAQPERSSLAPLLLDEAARDAVAEGIVTQQGAALGGYALVAARKVGLGAADAFPLVLTGGVFRHASSLLQDALVAQVRSELPEAEVVRASVEPVVGATLLALEEIHPTVTLEVTQKLRETAPLPTFFVTG